MEIGWSRLAIDERCRQVILDSVPTFHRSQTLSLALPLSNKHACFATGDPRLTIMVQRFGHNGNVIHWQDPDGYALVSGEIRLAVPWSMP